ncbi:MAG: NADH dehydrogenase subunit 5 [Candidatus Nomurabacteria bacterium GW2011_GWE1_32_28]|uniref:NADH dehydrogenase subunit 5 n=1 Tax=Candidatus Nomurabacteria bacterium GW2011_GWF1_31_48 TaxID=1618767 RepID=A0A0F9YE15_9BACT|nr:MAG: NADH dehydrogenase subunit 5 [Candidatus Nomurabacteria bacterium GW2011_GWF2_30_133]KKP28374.1 MAG: NADH dehydrogenase subunit 5 [Candidatus Nomurabacteria bacterium GW2011_GWE2_31_40]KKP29959.1 MAG: NADH dehydrogenase subunit 5 [Candidatus Nomurabacteria bacterium GW2011_GWF1_31_48]KKP35114.1 MAG: NADH dehydrogenase subunit 5 [Candidatus Nomurabacteria bacterium GW2011_GWE1_32_28]HAS80926.1 hypothetical protein [Candidatus Nomurabacteria bacterium]
MRTYLKTIKYLQKIFLFISIITMMVLPIMIVFYPYFVSNTVVSKLYFISHVFLFFVMMIRPLADIFINVKWIRPLVILRKGAGVLSASIIISFILAKLIIDPVAYFTSIGTLKYWSMVNYVVLAHIADLSAIILIVTSNNFSKRILGDWWKKVQKLSYVYFYGSVLYVYLSYKDIDLLIMLLITTALIFVASIKNEKRLIKNKENVI